MSIKLANNSGLSVDEDGLKLGPRLSVLTQTGSVQVNLKSYIDNSPIFNYTLYSNLVEIKLSNSSSSEYLMIKGFLPSAVSSSNSTYNNFLELHYKIIGQTYDTTYRMLHSGMYTGGSVTPTTSQNGWREVKWYYHKDYKYMCFADA